MYRNNISNNNERQLQHYRLWHDSEWESAKNHEYSKIRNYAQKTEHNSETLNKEEFKKILRLKDFSKGVEPLVHNGILLEV